MHNAPMSALPKTLTPEIGRSVVRIQALTLIWISVEAAVSLGAAWMAHSPALLGFGGDSTVELLSAAVVLWRFYSPSRGDHAAQRAARIAGGLLFALAACVALASILTLLGHVEARPSPIGIALLILAAVVMPCLAKQKRQLSAASASAALRADATESAVCGYLALIAVIIPCQGTVMCLRMSQILFCAVALVAQPFLLKSPMKGCRFTLLGRGHSLGPSNGGCCPSALI